MADRVGERLGNYRLLRLLGQGGFAEVYVGEHIHLDTLAAIKVLHSRIDSDDVEHFRTEARTIARLVHPHIVRVLEYHIEGNTPFLVVDYAPNGTLRKRHARGVPVPLPAVVSYVKQIASALQYAHHQKVIHRDVKPENMLVGRHNEILLSDFGIALVAQSSRYYSTQGIQDLAGTIAYMAPEQIQSQACPSSDQYSLGVVVYEWLSGNRPFQGGFTEIAVKHTMVPPPSLREKIPALSPAIEEVVMRALAKDPKHRFATVQAFAAAFEQACLKETTSSTTFTGISPHGENGSLSERGSTPATFFTAVDLSPQPPATDPLPIEAQSPEQTIAMDQALETAQISELPPRGVSRRLVLLGLAGAIITGTVGGGLAWLAHLQAQPGTVNPSNNGTALYTYRGHSDWVWSVAWSPNGKRIASASGDKTVQVWNAVGGGNPVTYRGHTDSVYTAAWAPDGIRIASAGYDKTVQIWNATDASSIYKYSGHSDWVWSVAWSPDGTHIASASGDKTVQVWNAANGSHLLTYRGHTASVYAVAWSPDGTHIASAGYDKTVQVWNATDGSPVYTYHPYAASIWSLAWSPDGKRIASAHDDKTVQVWDAIGGNHLYIYYGHSDFVYAVAWSLDGKRIASAGEDKTAQVWDAVSGVHPYVYSGHTNSVRSVVWSPDSKLIASGSWDKTVQVWQPK